MGCLERSDDARQNIHPKRISVTVYFSVAAQTATQRMPTPLCAHACQRICFGELELPAIERPGISGVVDIPGLPFPLYWRRMTRRSAWGDDPFTTGWDDPDSADNWIAVYRQVTPDECINYRTSRESVMVVDFYENRDAARRLPGSLH